MERFIARENFRRYRGELENGAQGRKRAYFLKLLVEEANRLGTASEQLNAIERHIVRLREVIARQIETIDILKKAGEPLERPRMILETLNALMLAYQAHRQKLSFYLARH